MKLLLIGGNGFIGRFTAPQLLNAGHEVSVFHRGSAPVPEGAAEIIGDRNRLLYYRAQFDREKMARALEQGFVDATELADWLAAKGVPFREAHRIVGALVQRAISSGKVLRDLSLEELRSAHSVFDASAMQALDFERAVERRNLLGGPAKARVLAALDDLQASLHARGVDAQKIANELGAK